MILSQPRDIALPEGVEDLAKEENVCKTMLHFRVKESSITISENGYQELVLSNKVD